MLSRSLTFPCRMLCEGMVNDIERSEEDNKRYSAYRENAGAGDAGDAGDGNLEFSMLVHYFPFSAIIQEAFSQSMLLSKP